VILTLFRKAPMRVKTNIIVFFKVL
jgi:hypothetical protein